MEWLPSHLETRAIRGLIGWRLGPVFASMSGTHLVKWWHNDDNAMINLKIVLAVLFLKKKKRSNRAGEGLKGQLPHLHGKPLRIFRNGDFEDFQKRIFFHLWKVFHNTVLSRNKLVLDSFTFFFIVELYIYGTWPTLGNKMWFSTSKNL